MKKLLPFVLLLCVNTIFAQSTNLDRERFHVSYVKLPTNPILKNDKRTYSINLNGITIQGFSKVKSPGTIDVNYNFSGTAVNDVKIDKTKHEKKDKDGNVTSTWYTYKVLAKFTSSATINVINAVTGQSYERSFQESTNYSSSSSFNSYYKAESYYKNNKYDIKSNHRSQQKAAIKKQIRSILNSKYGYVPYNTESEFLWILASKRHPERQKHHEAYDKMKVIFGKMKYDEPTDNIAKELEPIIAYFNDIIARYPGTKRKMRKVKYASYFNLANIYYYLDMPEKVKENAQKLIDNGYDKSDGKRFLRRASSLIESLKKNNMKSRHMKVLTEDISNTIHVEETVKKEASKSTPNIEVNKAYLITKKNDTILVDINTKDISTIGYKIKTILYSKDGVPVGTNVKNAKSCKELLFIDGLHFKNIKFKESSTKSGSLDIAQGVLGGATDKICKVLFESDKIGLYKFNDKEFVIVPAGSEKGKSTSGMGFVFSFKKKLANLAKSCPEVAKKAKGKAYANTEESLLKFCNDFTNCK